MKRYKVELLSKENGFVLDDHVFINSQNHRILNEESVFTRFSRSKDYIGLFQEVSTEFEFAKEELKFIEDAYNNYDQSLNEIYQLEIKLYIHDNTGSSSNSFQMIFNGIADWNNSNFENNNKCNVSFIEIGSITNLSKKQELEYTIENIDTVTKNYDFDTNTLLQTDVKAVWGVGEQENDNEFEVNIPESFNTLYSLPFPLSNTQDERKLPIFETYKDNILIEPILNTSFTQYQVIFRIQKCKIKLDFDSSVDGQRFYFQFRTIVYYSDSIDDYIHAEDSYAVGNSVTITYDAIVGSTINLDVTKLNKDCKIELKCIWWRSGTGGNMTKSTFILSNKGLFTVEQNISNVSIPCNLYKGASVIEKLSQNMNVPIINNLFGNTTSSIDILSDHFYFTSGNGLINKDLKFNASFNQIFKDISSMFGLGIIQKDDSLEIVKVSDIFDKRQNIIDLGEANRLSKKTNEIAQFKQFIFSSKDRSLNYVYNDKEYNSISTYESNVSSEGQFNKNMGLISIDTSYFNKRMLDFITVKLEDDKEGDNNIFGLVLNIFDDLRPIYGYSGNWEDKYGKAFNLEICIHKQIQNWGIYLKSILNSKNSMKRISILKNKSMKYIDNEGEEYFTSYESINESDKVFQNIEKIFGTKEYNIELDLSPALINEIKSNKNSMLKCTFENETYYGWLESIEINPLTKKADNVVLIEAVKL